MSTSSLSSSETSCSGYDGAVFRATDVWKKLIKEFRKGIPLKKKRCRMKFYEESFSGAEAIEWMQKHLQSSGTFGDVSKTQVTKLLEKFLEFKVISEVREKEGVFVEGNIYHFVTTANAFNYLDDDEGENVPTPAACSPRSTCYANSYAMMQFGNCSDTILDKRASLMEVDDCQVHLSDRKVECDSQELAAVWKQFVLTRLLRVVDLPTLDGVLNHETVDGKHILRNIRPLSHLLRLARSVSGSSVHAPAEVEVKLPAWVLMAQKYLMKWPEYNDEFHCELPIYRGFEIDVLRSLWEYYSLAKETFVPAHLHDLYFSVLRLVRSGNTDSAIHALSLCMLLLPRENSLKLHRLLRFMCKVSLNQSLVLTDLTSNKQLMLDRFTSFVLSGKKFSKTDCKELTAFMMDHYHTIFKIPDELRVQVDQFLAKKGASLEEATYSSSCKKVTAQEYARQRDETTVALAGLLEDIITNANLSSKERKSRLKKFQEQYPDIYAARFT